MNALGLLEPTEERPAVALRRGVLGGCIAVPVEVPDGLVGPMEGGAFIDSSDSRFSRAVKEIAGVDFHGAVPLHDRFDMPQHRELLTR